MLLNTAVSLSQLFRETPMPQRKRSKKCSTYDVEYIVQNPNRIIFLVKCTESYSKDTGHLVSLVYDDYVPRLRDVKKPLNADVRVMCECEAFLYWGSKYISTQEGYNFDEPEHRAPDIRDPHLKNKLCKHIVKVAKDLRGQTFKKMKNKYAVNDGYIFQTVTVEDTYPTIIAFLSKNRPEVNQEEFLLGLTEHNFEQKLLEIGAVT